MTSIRRTGDPERDRAIEAAVKASYDASVAAQPQQPAFRWVQHLPSGQTTCSRCGMNADCYVWVGVQLMAHGKAETLLLAAIHNHEVGCTVWPPEPDNPGANLNMPRGR